MRPSYSLLGLLALALLALATLATPASEAGEGRPRVVVIGIDGMDWELTREMMEAGELPNLARLAAGGSAAPLGTSVPPLSPVAWSEFITGLDAGGHGIFDFIHRHPDKLSPYLSTSEPRPTGIATRLGFLPEVVPLGKYCVPLVGEKQVLLRHGQPFWEPLEAAGIDTTVIRMPANFPVTGTATRELSGMGTPDILGTYGTFTFYTTDVFTERKSVGGGQVVPMDLWDDIARGALYGPPDPMLCDAPETAIDFRVFVDSEEPVALLEIDDQRLVLELGEWSDWLRVSFPLTGSGSVGGIVRFYLKQLRPEVELYASPINIDPLAPAQPISTPEGYAGELAEATGLFYTQGMPEDTRARSEGYLSRDEFLQQAALAAEENIEQFEYVLDQYEDGLLFYYFGNLDQVSHMMWGTMDPTHPGYVEERDAPYADVVPSLYRTADGIVGHAMATLGDDVTLVVMSDHGFASWKRSFHLNAWLVENGYLAPRNPGSTSDPGALLNIDWSRTRAYGLGFNGLYLNLEGREKNGIVPAQEKRALLEELRDRLLAVIDPETGGPAITRVYIAEDHMTSDEQLAIGPDIVVGYAEETRGHSNSAIGQVTGDPVLSSNTDDWSGDHGMDHTTVPGVLFLNRPLERPAANLRQLAAAILVELGVEGFPATASPETTHAP
ncbi:MAG: alkaline phosphatase family protein [Thermoanaerobaculia bacterium]|nr:alkaline phosphatase family protein [Thermoanaerobaculia bacterium]